MIWAQLTVIGFLVCLVRDPESLRCLVREASAPVPGARRTFAPTSRPGEASPLGVVGSGVQPGRPGLGTSRAMECLYFAESQRPSRPAAAAIRGPNEGV
jgi:hypothetical protein